MNITIKKLLKQLTEKCTSSRVTLVTSESCTGGGLSYVITQTPELSALLERGFVSYSNNSKQDLLNVSPLSLQIHGAVSKVVAEEMALGALKNSKALISIATTGIAGSDDEKANKGIIWIACAGINKSTIAIKREIKGSREKFIQKSIIEALKLLIKFI